jgi:glycosyltransferase involved in cell wall biosynthesis
MTIVRCLQRQSLKPDEVVIADDNSSQPIEAISRSLDCRYVRVPGTRSPHIARRSLARHIGTLASNGDIILYLDGDMIPSPNLQEFVWLSHTQRSGEVVIKVPRMFRFSMDRQLVANMRIPLQREATVHRLSFEDFQSDCFSVAKRSLTEIGGWDTGFLGWGEEDVELAYRFHLAGIPILSVRHPTLYGLHIDHAVDHRANAISLARNAHYFAEKHPEIKASRADFWRSLDSYLLRYRNCDSTH